MNINSDGILLLIKEAGINVNVDNLKNDINLAEQGIDSLDMMNIFLNIEEKYNIKVSDSDLNKLTSINSIVNYLLKSNL